MQVEWLLVLLIYLSLAYDVVAFVCQNSKPQKAFRGRRTLQQRTRLPGSGIAIQTRGFDSLWRRMQQAKMAAHTGGLEHDAVTRAMSRARSQAYAKKLEQEKIAAASLVDRLA